MIIRTVKSSDFREILDIYDEGYDEVKLDPNFGDYFRLTKPDKKRKEKWKSDQYNNLKHGDSVFYVAEEDNCIIGFCFVTKKDIPDSEMSHVGILAIRVKKDWRDKGVGSELLKHTINDSKGKFEIIEVFPFSNNEKSKQLYRKFGFKTWGIAPQYVKRDRKYIDLEYMYLDL